MHLSQRLYSPKIKLENTQYKINYPYPEYGQSRPVIEPEKIYGHNFFFSSKGVIETGVRNKFFFF